MCQVGGNNFPPKAFRAGLAAGGETCYPAGLRHECCEQNMMNPLAKPALTTDPAEWLGDAHPLVAQLGTADGLASVHGLAELLATQPLTEPAALREFLAAYQEQILYPYELPAIQTAFEHIGRNELRELIAYDQQMSNSPALQEFAAASQRIGRSQLQMLRPLKDERVVQRYLAAVESGEAHGWHTLVYGMTLVLYSLPLRQGLLGYAQQTMRGFIHAAARARGWKESECAALFAEFCNHLAVKLDLQSAEFTGDFTGIGGEKTLS